VKMPKAGDRAEFNLLDHNQEDELHHVTVYGRVAEVTDEKVTLDLWHSTEESEDSREKQRRNNCLDAYSIVRKAIVEWWPLRRGARTPSL
jgi:hypothetical protein